MVTDEFSCRLCLRPIWCQSPPKIKVHLDQIPVLIGELEQRREIEIAQPLIRGQHLLQVEFFGKTDTLSTPDHDHAIVIEDVSFFGIHSEKFKWQATYQPDYPEPWRSQQVSAGITLDPILRNKDYLGWNGVWRLNFTTPIFTWIHDVLDFGWVYP